MDSINQNQPEKNHQDLAAQDAVQKIRQIVEKAETCFFCTAAPAHHSMATRPMSVQKVDDQGNLWFLSSTDSHKNAEIPADSAVKLYFQGSPHSDFLMLHGTASITLDKAKIDELWKPVMKTWFTQGKDDPRITVIKVSPQEGYYWDNKHGNAVAGVKMRIGAALGKTLDDSIEGRLAV
ncbi:MAG: pyridoxamine 5'-phosphate oxidase family protein [Burkholderiaceae bacterium]